MEEYLNFWFVDEESGEEFFVELACKKGTLRKNAIQQLLPEAKEIAENYFEAPKLIDVISPEEAERMGLDTY